MTKAMTGSNERATYFGTAGVNKVMPVSDKSLWLIILIIVGAGIIAACQVGKVPMALSTVQDDLDLDLATVSWLISAFAVVGALIGIVTGFVADRTGPRRMAVIGLVVLGIGSFLGALAKGAPSLILARVVEGVGYLGVTVAAPTLIATIAPARIQERAMAIWAIFMPAGLTLVMLAAPLVKYLTWRGFWVFNAAVLIGYAILFGFALKGVTPQSKLRRPIARDIKETMSAPGPWVLACLFGIYTAAFFAVFGFLPSYLSERLAISVDSANMLSAVAIAASAGGNIVCGQLRAQGIRSTPLLLAGFVAMSLCAVGIFNSVTPAAVVVLLCVFFSFAAGLIPVLILASAPRFSPRPELVGATMGFIMQGNNVGVLVGPVVTGWAVSDYGWHAVAPVVAVCALLALSLIFSNRSLREIS